jgi:hypothetical protein
MKFTGSVALIEIIYNEKGEIAYGKLLGTFENWTREQLFEFIEDFTGEKFKIDQETEHSIALITDSCRHLSLINKTVIEQFIDDEDDDDDDEVGDDINDD